VDVWALARSHGTPPDQIMSYTYPCPPSKMEVEGMERKGGEGREEEGNVSSNLQ